VSASEEIWLSPEDAIHAIEMARDTGTPLYGFDGAFLVGKTTQLSLEDSWDYSGTAWPAVIDPYAHAIQFIKCRAEKGLHFEIVTGPTSN
jgi:hypothetical protein